METAGIRTQDPSMLDERFTNKAIVPLDHADSSHNPYSFISCKTTVETVCLSYPQTNSLNTK